MENYESDRRRDADRACSESLLTALKEHHGNPEKPTPVPVVIQEAESERITVLNGEIAELRRTIRHQRKLIDGLCDETKAASPRVSDIVNVVSDYYEVSKAQIIGFNRSPKYSFPRQVAYYLARQVTAASYPEIGRWIGDRDHTSVVHGCQKIEKQLEVDEILRDDIDVLRAKIDAVVFARISVAEEAAA